MAKNPKSSNRPAGKKPHKQTPKKSATKPVDKQTDGHKSKSQLPAGPLLYTAPEVQETEVTEPAEPVIAAETSVDSTPIQTVGAGSLSAAAPPVSANTAINHDETTIPNADEQLTTASPMRDEVTQVSDIEVDEPIAFEELSHQEDSPTAEILAPQPPRRKLWVVISLLVLLFLAAIILQLHINGRQTAVEKVNQALIAEVAQRAVLPTDEKPSITTVVDKSKLNQSFLGNAEEGDKVLLYFQAGKAIVYRPSTQQIVNIGPLSQPAAKLFLRNGTSQAALPTSVSQKLGSTSAYTIVSQDTAVRRDYKQTFVVDINGNRPDLATKIATTIGAKVVPLPAGETPPAADFLIIVGADAE